MVEASEADLHWAAEAAKEAVMTDADLIAQQHFQTHQRIQGEGSLRASSGERDGTIGHTVDEGLTGILGAKRLSGRLSGMDDDEELHRSTRDLNAIVSKQTRRRRRRASVDILSTDEELVAKGRWNRIGSGVKIGAQISTISQTAKDERQHLDTMKKRLRRSLTQREHHDTCQGCVLHPRSRFRQQWDGMLFLMLMYCAFVIPFRLGFDEKAVGTVLVWEAVIDCAFLLDVLLSFRTGFMLEEENEDSRIEMLPRPIAKNYVRKWFFIDIISAFPTQLILLMSDDKGKTAASSNSVSKLPRLLRVPKLIRMIRLMKVFRILRLFKSVSLQNPSHAPGLFNMERICTKWRERVQTQQGILNNLIEKSGLPPVRTTPL